MKELAEIIGLIALMLNLNFMNNLFAQDLENSDLEELSIEKFNRGEYYAAISGFEKLLNRYPKEESYNYYLGRCYLHTNQSKEKTVKLLQNAALSNYNADVYYYLAWSHYKLYDFDKAEIAIQNFTNLARKKQIRKLRPEYLKSLIINARKETEKFPVINVNESLEITLPEINSIFSDFVEGEFLGTTEVFSSKDNKKPRYKGVLYVPSNLKEKTIIYYPGNNKKVKSGTNIYSATRSAGNNYPSSSDLTIINSDFNEDYPYFDSETNTLYFSSDRPGGLGGFDVYKSVFDATSQTFSEPQRLSFPINSSSDDFLYVIDSTGKNAAFISNRNNRQGKFTVYRINVSSDFGYHLPETKEETIKLSALSVTQDKVPPELDKTEIQTLVHSNSFEEPDSRLHEAMKYQLKCDSLQNIILTSKAKLSKEKDQNNRKVLFSLIAKAKREIQLYQNKADDLFRESKTLQQINHHNTQVVTKDINEIFTNNKFIQKDKEVEGITLFSYNSSEKGSGADDSNKNFGSEDKEFQNSFTILSQSPYSSKNPIPKDYQIPEGLIYRIQLGAFSQNLSIDAFGGLTPLMAEEISSKELTKYYVGIFNSSKEARKALEQVKSIGFNDAFIVPYLNRKKISIQAAREYEFGKKK